MIQWLKGRRGDMVESALTMPLLALVALALVNLALAGYCSVTANNAANYAARVASVSQTDAVGRGLAAAQHALAGGVGTYHVEVAADTSPGGQVTVRVGWEFPNVYGSLMPLFGGANQPLRGEAVAAFRKEGW